MRVGSVVFSTEQGLGYLAKSFHDNGIVTDVVVLRHGKYLDHPEWYPEAPVLKLSQLGRHFTERMIREVDLMLFFETPFEWDLINRCRQVGIPSVLMPMHECTLSPIPVEPDYFLCPSHLDRDVFRDRKSSYLPVPVDRINSRRRERVNTFIHNSGHGGLLGRNGTRELLDAISLVRSPAKFIIRSQVEISHPSLRDPRVEYFRGTAPRDVLFDEGEVFVFPEKFNGLSLPIQEAFAAGMVVMCSRRYPMTEWLPLEPMIPVHAYRTNRISSRYRTFEEAIIRPEDIASTIDNWYGLSITDLSERGIEYGRTNSWSSLKFQYQDLLKSLTLSISPLVTQ